MSRASRAFCNISALPPQTRELISQSLRGQSLVASEALQLTEAWSFGGLAVLHQAWQAFGLNTILRFVANPRTAGLLKAMTLGRIFFPSARLALVDHARGALSGAACGVGPGHRGLRRGRPATAATPPPSKRCWPPCGGASASVRRSSCSMAG